MGKKVEEEKGKSSTESRNALKPLLHVHSLSAACQLCSHPPTLFSAKKEEAPVQPPEERRPVRSAG